MPDSDNARFPVIGTHLTNWLSPRDLSADRAPNVASVF